MNSKKLIPIICLVIIGLLVIATIVMAIVPKSYIPMCAKPDSIYLSNGRVFESDNDADKEIYNNLFNYYEKAFSESSINAMFNGRLSYSAVNEYSDTVTKVSSLGTYIMFTFGKDYTIKIDDVEYSYNRMVIALNSTNVMKTVKAYLYNNDTFTDGTNYYINTIGNLENLVKYANTIEA